MKMNNLDMGVHPFRLNLAETVCPRNLLEKDFIELRIMGKEYLATRPDEDLYYYSDKYEYFIRSTYGIVVCEISELKRSQIDKALILSRLLYRQNGSVSGSYVSICRKIFGKDDYELLDLRIFLKNN